MEEKKDYKLYLDTATMAGKLMLQNGAEIYRVEDTIRRMLEVSGLKTAEAYVTATGIMVTLDDPKEDSMTVIKRIPSRGTDLNMVSMVNDISRKFCSGQMTLKEVFHDLKHLDSRQYTELQKALGIIAVSLFFALVFGGTWKDALAAGIDGVLIVMALWFSKWLELNAFMETMLSSVLLAAGAVIMSWFMAINVEMVIIGAIMPIVPGAAFTTAIRDTLQGDYVAGSAKALESLIKVAAIVVGAGLGMLMAGGFRL